MSSSRLTILFLPMLLFIIAARADAQGVATSFDELRHFVDVGDTISISDTAGRETTGRIGDLTGSTLGLQVAGSRRAFQESQINTIRQRRADSLGNGAVTGFAVGGVFGLVFGILHLKITDGATAKVIPLHIGMLGGIGAGIGVGVDAFLKGQQTIYARPQARLSISPILGNERTGLRVALSF